VPCIAAAGSGGRPRPPSTAEAAYLAAELQELGCGGGCATAAFVRRCCGAEEAAAPLLRGAFAAAPALQALLLCAPARAAPGGGAPAALAARFEPASSPPPGAPQLRIAVCGRARALPPLVVRRARVQDHDELLPLLARAQAAGGAPACLARLPDGCRPGEPFALARLIASQDAGNAVLAAQPWGGGPLVGFLVATADVDVPLLVEAFDLGPFDGFVDPALWQRLEAQACAQAATEAAAAGEAGGAAGRASDGDGAAAAGAGDGAGDAQADQQHKQAAPASGQPPAAGVDMGRSRQLLAGLVQDALASGDAARPPHALLAVTMLVLNAAWEVHQPDLLAAAFEEFPGKVGQEGTLYLGWTTKCDLGWCGSWCRQAWHLLARCSHRLHAARRRPAHPRTTRR
jgi:hypothetical protein